MKEEHWNENKKCIRKSHPNAATLNKLLVERMNDLQRAISTGRNDLVPDDSNPKLDINLVSPVTVTVFVFRKGLISELRLDNKIGNAGGYEATVSALTKYHPGPNLYFEQIDYKFLDKYNKYLLL